MLDCEGEDDPLLVKRYPQAAPQSCGSNGVPSGDQLHNHIISHPVPESSNGFQSPCRNSDRELGLTNLHHRKFGLADLSDSDQDDLPACYKDPPPSPTKQTTLKGTMSGINVLRHHRMRTNLLLVLIGFMGLYLFIFESSSAQSNIPDVDVDVHVIEKELDESHKIEQVTYRSPFSGVLAPNYKPKPQNSQSELRPHQDTRLKYHALWAWADKVINRHELFPDTNDILTIVNALETAPIVNVDVLDMGDYESGTSEKWVVTLEGGQKAMMKLMWEEKGKMKKGALCNVGYEMPAAEIAAFHLHRILGYRNTPPVSGRRVNLRTEILPVASPQVAKQITLKQGNETCVTGRCFYCKTDDRMCPMDGIVEASIAFWVPRHLKLYTYPPKYMPWSTPRMDEWEHLGFNNRTYCHKLRSIHPYEVDYYYDDLFDFAAIDTIMYHYDSKHYVIYDHSEAHGLTVRLDHGRTFCAYDRDDDNVFLAPITQCCRLRYPRWEALKSFRGGLLSRRLRSALANDPLAPVLDEAWYPVLERRLKKVVSMIERCAKANGGLENVLVG